MSDKYDALKDRALIIKNETQEGANTANRVGQLFYDIIDCMEEGGGGSTPSLGSLLTSLNTLSNPSGNNKILEYNGGWGYINTPSGGSGGGISLADVWNSLNTPDDSKQIDSSHLSNALQDYITTDKLKEYSWWGQSFSSEKVITGPLTGVTSITFDNGAILEGLASEANTIKVTGNIYATGGVSALGKGSSGGGGGDTLNIPLKQINEGNLGAGSNNQALGKKSDGQYGWIDIPSGGGGTELIGLAAALNNNAYLPDSSDANKVLGWTGSTYDWVTAGGGGGTAGVSSITGNNGIIYDQSTGNVISSLDSNWLSNNASVKYANSAGSADTASTADTATNANIAAKCTGNADTATKLQQDVVLWGNSFNGSAGIGTSKDSVAVLNYARALELYGLDDTNAAFIDFHYHDEKDNNYTSRIIESEKGVVGFYAQSNNNSVATGVSVGTEEIDSSFLRIGNIKIVYDKSNNALKLLTADNKAANLYTTGGISALGMSQGISSIDTFAFNYLTVNNELFFNTINNSIKSVDGNIKLSAINNNSNGKVYINENCIVNETGGVECTSTVKANIVEVESTFKIKYNGNTYTFNTEKAIELGLLS